MRAHVSVFHVKSILFGASVSALLIQSASFAEDHSQEALLGEAITKFHAAFKSSDAERLKDLVTEDLSLVTAGGLGRSAADFLDVTRELIAERPDLVMELTAESIELGPLNWNIAAGQGAWLEKWTQDDMQVLLSGRYQAMWRYLDGAWRLSGLMLVPTQCTGPYCE